MELELTEGMRFDKGYLSGYFVSDPERQEAVLEDAYVLPHQSKISSEKDLLPVGDITESGVAVAAVATPFEGDDLHAVGRPDRRRRWSILGRSFLLTSVLGVESRAALYDIDGALDVAGGALLEGA